MVTGEVGDFRRRYTAAQLASDLSRLLDHLGIGSTAVLGYSQGGAIAQQLVLEDPSGAAAWYSPAPTPTTCHISRELEGHLVPLLLNVMGMERFAKLVISQGLKQLDKRRADWVVGLISNQDRTLMVSAWRAAMAFDSRRRLAEITCPTLVVAAANDDAVRSTTQRCSTTGSGVLNW